MLNFTTNKYSIFLYNIYTKKSFFDNIKNIYRPIYGLLEEILCLCDNKSSILDFGCGCGPLSFILAKYKNPNFVIGYDINESYIKKANQINQFKNLSFTSNFNSLNSKFDIIIIADVLHHIIPFQNKKYILNHIFTLNPEIIIIKDLNPNNKISCYFNNFTDYISTKSKVEYISVESIKNIIPSNYRIEQIKYKNFFLWSNYIIKIRKL